MRARMTMALPQVGFAALVALCVLVPTVFTTQTAEAFMVPKVTVLLVGTLLAVGGVGAWALAARRLPLPRSRLALPLGLVLVLTTISTLFSSSPITSVLGHYGRYDGLLALVTYVALGTATVAYCWKDPRRLTWIAVALVVGGVIGLGYVTIQQFGWDWIDWRDETGEPIDRPYGLLGNSNFSGAHFAIVLPLVLALRTRVDRAVPRAALLVLAALLALGVWWTGTRGGALATVGGLAAMGLLLPAMLPRILRWAAVGLTVAGLGLIAVSATADSIPGADLVGEVRFTQTATLDTRVELWGTALQMIGDHPLLGVGPDTFHLAYPEYRSPEAADNLVINADEAHDIYLDRAATSGLPAALTYLWFLGLLVTYAWRARNRLEDDFRWLLAGFGGALAAYLLQGLVSIDVVPVALIGWIAASAVVALADPAALAGRAEAAAQPSSTRLRPLPVIALAGFAGVAAILGLLIVRPFIADLRYRDGLEATQAGAPLASGAADFEAAADWFPAEPRYHFRLADQLVAMATTEATDDELRRRLLEEALLGYEQALDRNPGDIAIEQAEARAEVALSAVAGPEHLRTADRIYRSLIERVQTDPQLYAEHGSLLAAWSTLLEGQEADAMRADAIDALEHNVDLVGGTVETLRALASLYQTEGRLEEARGSLQQALGLDPENTELQAALDQLSR